MATVASEYQVFHVPVVQVVRGDNQRTQSNVGFNPQSLAELATSIKEDGLTNPITLTAVGYVCGECGATATGEEVEDCTCGESEGWMIQYRIVAGERRFRAISQILEWKDVPAFIREMDDLLQERSIMAHENLGRVDLNPMEEAEVYWEFTSDFGLSEEETAERCGVTLARVAARLKLRSLVPMAQDLVAKGQLPILHAEEMCSLPTSLQHEALKLLGKTAVPFTMFKQYLCQLIESQTEQLGFDLTAFWMEQMTAVQDEQAALRAREATIFTNAELPAVAADRKDTAGDILVRYMRDLHEAGFERESQAVGNVLDVLLKFRKVKNFREAAGPGDLMEQGQLFQGGGR